MRVAYDGAPFHGFARNPGVVTVQQTLEEALTTVLRHPVAVTGAGRTDAGVHSVGQVVSFDASQTLFDPLALRRALNRLLNPIIAVDQIEATDPHFNARFSCVARTYRYHILNRQVIDPLRRNFSWHLRQPLDLVAMQKASEQVLGTHDFRSFSKQNKTKGNQSFVRSVQQAEWQRVDDLFVFEITASAFTHQLVRSLVGMCVIIGQGRREIAAMTEVLQDLSREHAPSPAPSHGLVFWHAKY